MSGGVDRQIFDDAGRPEDAPEQVPDTSVDDAVSATIRGLSRGESPTPPPLPTRPGPARPQPPAGLEDVEDRSTSGLLQALLNERDRRQDLHSQVERYKAAEADRRAREQKPALSERLFTNPDETLEELRREWTQPLQETIATLQLNQDFALAEARHGAERFQTAWNTWYSAVEGGKDATSYFAVMNAQSPGEAVMRWYKQRERDELIGDDLDAFKQKVIEEHLSGRAQAQPRQEDGKFAKARPQAPQRLPTATSRLGASNRDEDDDLNDGSDAAIFAAARPTRRGER